MKMLTALMSALVAFGIAGSASAGTTIKSGYGGVVGTLVDKVMHEPSGQILSTAVQKPNGQIFGTVAHNQGTLPFTGLNLATSAVIALLLIAIGVVVTRVSRRRDNT